MTRFIYANVNLCSGCEACVDACAEAHKNKGLQPQSRIAIVRNGDASSPVVCRHCENAPCAQVCPVGAITISKNAIELHEDKCIGCKFCVIACPFGAITLSLAKVGIAAAPDQAEDNGTAVAVQTALGVATSVPKPTGKIAVKCDLCDFSEKGPECIQACSTHALFLVDDKMMKKSVSAKRASAIKSMPFMENPSVKK